jgi:hypothetical protein
MFVGLIFGGHDKIGNKYSKIDLKTLIDGPTERKLFPD